MGGRKAPSVRRCLLRPLHRPARRKRQDAANIPCEGNVQCQDGSLTLYAGAKSPGVDRESNWLPASGPFSLYVRAYWAGSPILDGQHAGYPLEEGIQRSLSVSGHRWRNTRQPFLDRTLQRGFDNFAGQAEKLLRELVNPGGTNIHGAPIIIREHRELPSWGPRLLSFRIPGAT